MKKHYKATYKVQLLKDARETKNYDINCSINNFNFLFNEIYIIKNEDVAIEE